MTKLFIAALALIFAGAAYGENYVDPCALEAEKIRTVIYYEHGAYDRELEHLVRAVERALPRAEHPKQVVIFDVDDVALSTYPLYRRFDFGLAYDIFCELLGAGSILPAIPSMQRLYRSLLDAGYGIVFMTGRSRELYDQTHHNLIASGYKLFEKLIMYDGEPSIGVSWKARARARLVEEGYEIVCTLDDGEKHLAGGNTGLAVKVPNHLYT